MITNSFSRDELEEIIKKYGDSVYRLAFMNVKKRELADDIYQDVFLKLIKKKERIDSEEHLNKDSALGYGYDSGSVESIFECSNGTKAYFLKSSEYIEEQVVIFVAYGIQYQLFVDDTKEGTEFAKDVVEMMCQ